MATTALTWTLGIVVLDSDYAFTVTNVLTHGIPYFGLVHATAREKAEGRRREGRPGQPADVFARSAVLFLLPLVAIAFLEEWGWDRLVWHENGAVFPGPELLVGPTLLSLLVPLLAVPQATHYLLDAFIWRISPVNIEAAQAIGLRPAASYMETRREPR